MAELWPPSDNFIAVQRVKCFGSEYNFIHWIELAALKTTISLVWSEIHSGFAYPGRTPQLIPRSTPRGGGTTYSKMFGGESVTFQYRRTLSVCSEIRNPFPDGLVKHFCGKRNCHLETGAAWKLEEKGNNDLQQKCCQHTCGLRWFNLVINAGFQHILYFVLKDNLSNEYIFNEIGHKSTYILSKSVLKIKIGEYH